jgi:hypothetical protein
MTAGLSNHHLSRVALASQSILESSGFWSIVEAAKADMTCIRGRDGQHRIAVDFAHAAGLSMPLQLIIYTEN